MISDDWDNISEVNSSPSLYPSTPEHSAVLHTSDFDTMSDLKLSDKKEQPEAKQPRPATAPPPAALPAKTPPKMAVRAPKRADRVIQKTFPVPEQAEPLTVIPVTTASTLHPADVRAKSAPQPSPPTTLTGKKTLFVVEDSKTGRFLAVVQTQAEQANAALKALEDSVKSNPVNLHKAIDALGLKFSSYALTKQ
jgi:hypothetical protein